MTQELQTEIEQVFKESERISDSQKYGDLKRLWDEDDPDPFYLAEEQADWKIGWDELKNIGNLYLVRECLKLFV